MLEANSDWRKAVHLCLTSLISGQLLGIVDWVVEGNCLFVYTRFYVPFITNLCFLRDGKTSIFKNDPIFGFLAIMDGWPLQVNKLGNGQQYRR